MLNDKFTMKNISIRYLKGVGPRKELIFNSIGVYAIKDLIYYFPFRYQDRTNVVLIKDFVIGEYAVTKGVVSRARLKRLDFYRRSSKVKSIFEIILQDSSGQVRCVWFNQHYLADAIKVGDALTIYGKLYRAKSGLQIVSAEYELSTKEDALEGGRIIGVYRSPSVFSQKFMRNSISSVIEDYAKKYPDPLPFYIRKQKNIPNIAASLNDIHFPSSWKNARLARERFIFEELFFSQISVYLRKAKHRSQKSIPVIVRNSRLEEIRNNLGFDLTASQETVLAQILKDMVKPYPMHRLLQGDVGCGKTVVAAFALAACLDSEAQAALMVPTEVLAYQHEETLKDILKGTSLLAKDRQNSIRVLTSSLSKKE